MQTSASFDADWVSPPGETVRDILRRRRIPIAEFAKCIGRTQSEAHDIIAGRTSIDGELAQRLAECLGASNQFWIERESHFRHSLARLEARIRPSDAPTWLAQLPHAEMAQLGWLARTSFTSSRVMQCLRFFGVASVDDWRQQCAALAQSTTLRTSRTFRSNVGAIAAWLRQGAIEASCLDVDDWDPLLFQERLHGMRQLTRNKYPQSFIPKLQTSCGECGVAVVLLRAPNGCRASGAARVLPDGRRLILLSARYLSDDHLWFTFFHEAGHLLLHSDRYLFIDTLAEQSSDETKEEIEANSFAIDVLIPQEHREEMLELPLDGRAVIAFARRIGIAPGIVVGQLQFQKKRTYRQLNNLKRRYVWID